VVDLPAPDGTTFMTARSSVSHAYPGLVDARNGEPTVSAEGTTPRPSKPWQLLCELDTLLDLWTTGDVSHEDVVMMGLAIEAELRLAKGRCRCARSLCPASAMFPSVRRTPCSPSAATKHAARS